MENDELFCRVFNEEKVGERGATSKLRRRRMWIAQELQASTHNLPSTSHSAHQLKTFSCQATKLGSGLWLQDCIDKSREIGEEIATGFHRSL
jgi:hypothetical protein